MEENVENLPENINQDVSVINEQSQNGSSGEGPSTSEAAENPPPVKRKGSKKRRKQKSTDSVGDEHSELPQPEYGYPLQFEGADVLPSEEVEAQERPNVPTSQVNVGADTLASQPSDKVYVQETSGFRKAEREQYEKYISEQQKLDAELNKESTSVSTTIGAIETGIVCQNFFRTFALILQGLLAGFSTAHCLLVIFLSPPYFNNADFINHYAPLAMPLHCAYYVVLVVCTVAVLDRYDVNRSFLRVVWRALTFQSGGLSVLLYLVVVAVNAVCLPVEERMTLYFHNTTTISAPTDDHYTHSTEVASTFSFDLNYWRALLITRAVLTSLGWFLVAIRPTTDLLTKHMRKAGDEFNEITKPTGTTEGVTPQAAVILPNPS